MKEIDTSSWKEYKISDLFSDLERGKCPIFRNLADGNCPVIAASMYNQGITGYYDITPKYSNKLTVSLNGVGSGYFSFHPYPFTANSDCGILHERIKLSKHVALYLCGILNKLGEKFGYGEKVTKEKLFKESISLPSKMGANSKYEPDWQYMEDYIKSIEKKVQFSSVQFSLSSKTQKGSIDSHKWKEFKIDDLFHNKFVKPEVWHTRELVEDEIGIPYVVRTKFNNGIKYNVLKTEKMTPNPAGTISFGAENATFFYQEKEYVSGRDIYYIDTTHLLKNTCLFLVACLQKITDKYSYNYGMFPDLVKEEIIKLPTDDKGNPDWVYMDNYMENIIKDTQAKLDNLVYY